MKKTQILVVCRHAEILATIVRLINNNPEWNATGCETDEQAIAAFNDNFRLALLGSGVSAESEATLTAHFTSVCPGIKIVQHYGGGSGLLTTEIMEGLR